MALTFLYKHDIIDGEERPHPTPVAVCDNCFRRVDGKARVFWGTDPMPLNQSPKHPGGTIFTDFTAAKQGAFAMPSWPISAGIACSRECHVWLWQEDQESDYTQEEQSEALVQLNRLREEQGVVGADGNFDEAHQRYGEVKLLWETAFALRTRRQPTDDEIPYIRLADYIIELFGSVAAPTIQDDIDAEEDEAESDDSGRVIWRPYDGASEVPGCHFNLSKVAPAGSYPYPFLSIVGCSDDLDGMTHWHWTDFIGTICEHHHATAEEAETCEYGKQ